MPNQFTEPGQGMPASYAIDHDAGASRIFSLDVIRGIALLGILLISIWEFGGFSTNQQTGIRILKKNSDHILLVSMMFLFEGKMRALFALVLKPPNSQMLMSKIPSRAMPLITSREKIREAPAS